MVCVDASRGDERPPGVVVQGYGSEYGESNTCPVYHRGKPSRQQSAPHDAMNAKSRKQTSTRIRLGGLPALVGYHLRLAQVAIFRDFNEALGEFEITPGLFGVLEVIASNPGLKQTQLARAVQLDRSSVVSVIDKMERRGLVERQVALADRRSNALVLTAGGEELLARLRPLVVAHEERLAADLSTAERQKLIELLGRVFPKQR